MKKYILLLYFIILLANHINAQMETSNWYFGDKTGLKFNNSGLGSLIGGQIQYNEGVSSISDCEGNLLFYTDGVNVWNRNHSIMVNGSGLLGHYSATQGSVIIPQPGNCNLFFIFTVDAKESDFVNGFRYSIVDMSLQNGLGEVTTKNVLLYAKSSEKMTAVRHSNGENIWVITHQMYTNSFYAYLVTSNGVNPNPVVSSVGLPINNSNDALGQMKLSPDGSKLAYVTLVSKITEIFDFDNSNGILSNPITIPASKFTVYGGLYGLEFSADAGKLYVTNHNIDYPTESGSLYQIDLLAGSDTNIINSTTVVGTNTPPSDLRGLQLGPDLKIYVSRSLGMYLGVINNPEIIGNACNYVDFGVPTNGKISCWTSPNFMTSFFNKNQPIQQKADFNTNQNCLGKTTTFTNISIGNPTEFYWDFGDGNTSALKNPTHIYTQSGEYIVRLIIKSKCCSDTVIKTIFIDDCDSNLYVPNIITPNGDGINDKFIIDKSIYGRSFTVKHLTIYNRWGKKVYESLNYQNDFDGGDLPEGVYYVTIIAKGSENEIEYNGSLQILR